MLTQNNTEDDHQILPHWHRYGIYRVINAKVMQPFKFESLKYHQKYAN